MGHGLPSVELDADRMDYLVERLVVAELPVVLDVFPRFDDATARHDAARRGRDGLAADGLLQHDNVHPDLEMWLRVLERPTWYLAARLVPRPFGSRPLTRVCRASNDAGSVIAVSTGGTLTISAAQGDPARDVLRNLGSEPAFQFEGISAPTDSLAEILDAAPTDTRVTADRLVGLGIDPSAAADVASAMSNCSAHAEITCTTVGSGSRTTDPHPVAVFDTPRGRLVATSSTAADGIRWTSFSPGSDARIRAALDDMAHRAERTAVS